MESSDKCVRKQVLKIITIILTIILIILTFFSKSIYNLLLPEVEVVNLKSGAMEDNYFYNGVVEYTDIVKIYTQNIWKIEDVYVKSMENIEKGQAIAKVDESNINLMEKSKELEIKTLEREVEVLKKRNLDSNDELNIKMEELKIAKMQFENIRNGLNEKGEILSPVNGQIIEVNCEIGKMYEVNESILYLSQKDSELCVTWNSSVTESSKFSVNRKVDVSIKSISGTLNSESTITKKEYNKEENNYKISASLDSDKAKKYNIQMHEKAFIKYIDKSDDYDYILPKECVVNNKGKKVLYIVSEKEGIFGKENYIEEIPIDVIAGNNYYVAIETMPYYAKDVVLYSSTSIEPGEKVKVKK